MQNGPTRHPRSMKHGDKLSMLLHLSVVLRSYRLSTLLFNGYNALMPCSPPGTMGIPLYTALENSKGRAHQPNALPKYTFTFIY